MNSIEEVFSKVKLYVRNMLVDSSNHRYFVNVILTLQQTQLYKLLQLLHEYKDEVTNSCCKKTVQVSYVCLHNVHIKNLHKVSNILFNYEFHTFDVLH